MTETSSQNWEENFSSYLNELSCPYTIRREQIEWLLEKAIDEKFNSNAYFKNFTTKSTAKQTIPPEFTAGLKKLAEKLQIQIHPESPEVTLEACKLVVEAVVNSKGPVDLQKENLLRKDQIPLGFDTGDQAVNEAGNCLKFLYGAFRLSTPNGPLSDPSFKNVLK